MRWVLPKFPGRGAILRWWGLFVGVGVVGVAVMAMVLRADAQSPRAALEFVDLELVLAVDVSLSMDLEEQKLQRDGYVAALRDPKLMEAIKRGPNARIAVTYVEWAGGGIQSVIVPWQVIASARDANRFADALAAKPINRALMTSISRVLDFSRKLFDSSGVRGLRRVIDVSGDGPNNQGGHVEVARDKTVAAGIVINGLAIQIRSGVGSYSYFDLPDLDKYYKDCVVGGPGSFVLSIKKRSEFATAIRKKLLLEISGRTPVPAPRVRRAQWVKPGETKYDCLIGEKMWFQYQLDGGNE